MDVTADSATPIRIEGAWDDPAAVRALVERHGPYPSIAHYLPPSATRSALSEAEREETLPWFRANWAVDGRWTLDGVDAILHNRRFVEAAGRLFGTVDVTPTTVVVNVNAPMPAGAVHLDIPSFDGATRDRYPLSLLQAMGTSGLFEPWRVVEAGAVSWFYDGAGGAYDYWPDGLDQPMCSERPPFDNVALVADNDRMYHRIGWVGDPDPRSLALSAQADIRHGDGGWTITDGDRVRAAYPDAQVRISVLWKAQVRLPGSASDRPAALTPELVAEIITADLRARGVHATAPTEPLTDETWIAFVHSTYYPLITVGR